LYHKLLDSTATPTAIYFARKHNHGVTIIRANALIKLTSNIEINERKLLVMMDAQVNTLTPSILLQTPWFSQLQDNGEDSSACAQACLLMLLHYYQSMPSNGLFKLEDLCAIKPNWLTAYELVSLAAKPFKLSLMPFVAGNVLSLRQYLLSGRPVMLFVNYALLDFESHLPQGEDLRTHWLLVIGYQDDDFVLHDPLWMPLRQRGRGGAYRKVHYSTLQTALAHHQQPNAIY
jgi:hypothetical protein